VKLRPLDLEKRKKGLQHLALTGGGDGRDVMNQMRGERIETNGDGHRGLSLSRRFRSRDDGASGDDGGVRPGRLPSQRHQTQLISIWGLVATMIGGRVERTGRREEEWEPEGLSYLDLARECMLVMCKNKEKDVVNTHHPPILQGVHLQVRARVQVRV
jgi:hypothetical protein